MKRSGDFEDIMARRRRLTDASIYESDTVESTAGGSTQGAARVADASYVSSQRFEARAASTFVKPASLPTADARAEPSRLLQQGKPQPGRSVAALASQLETRLSEPRRLDGATIDGSSVDIPTMQARMSAFVTTRLESQGAPSGKAKGQRLASAASNENSSPNEPQGLASLLKANLPAAAGRDDEIASPVEGGAVPITRTSAHAPLMSTPANVIANTRKRQLEEVSQDTADVESMPDQKRSRFTYGVERSVAAMGKAFDSADRVVRATFGCGLRRRAPASSGLSGPIPGEIYCAYYTSKP